MLNNILFYVYAHISVPFRLQSNYFFLDYANFTRMPLVNLKKRSIILYFWAVDFYHMNDTNRVLSLSLALAVLLREGG